MSRNMTNKAVTSQSQSVASSPFTPVARSSRRARNDERWDSLKEEIFEIYILKDSTLQDTKQLTEDRHGFVASVRKWKEKLKEWNFDKNISASDMTIVLSKGEKRAREEGKETAIFHGGTPITRERIEQFKRRKTCRKDIEVSPSADTPKNITYHTPEPGSPNPVFLRAEQNVSPILENDEVSLADVLPRPRTAVSGSYRSAKIPELATVVEMPAGEEESEEESEESDEEIEEGLSFSTATRASYSRNALHQPDPITTSVEFTTSTEDLHPEQASSATLDLRDSSKNVPLTREQPSDLNDNCEILLPDTGSINENLHRLSLSIPKLFVLEFSVRATKATPKLMSDTQLWDTGSNNSVLAQANTTPVASEGTIKTALEFHSQGWLTTAIFEILAGTESSEFEAQRTFCENLWHLGPSFEKKHCMEEALMTYDLIHAGYQVTRRSWTDRENIKCLVYRARVLRKMEKVDQSEALYREAIKALQERGDGNCELECLLDLADFLSARDMDFEALSLLLHAYIGKSWCTDTSAENQKMLELLNCVQRIHSKTETGEGFASVTAIISRMRTIQMRRIDAHNYQNLWFELVQLGSHYSSFEKFKLADLCFGFSAPRGNSNTNPKNRLRLAQFRKERSVHCKRQGKFSESLWYLTLAFNQLLSLGPGDYDGIEEEEGDLVVILTQLLDDLCPERLIECHPEEHSAIIIAWGKARTAFDKLYRHRVQSRARELVYSNYTKFGLNAHQGAISLSSNGSSMLSRESLNSFGVTYSVGSASSIVSNSVFMVP
ncbi:hypothetical protein V8E51_000274 [Hyaloscypha variabilis]